MTPPGQSNCGPMILLPRAVELDMTCGACPSQWEGKLEDGRFIYVRYRHSYLTVGLGESPDSAVDDSLGARWLYMTDEIDGGVMTTETMCELTGLRLAEGVTVDEDRWWEEEH